MKILVVSNLYPPDVLGGYELGCRQAVDALRARSHEVLVLTSASKSSLKAQPHVLRSLKLTDLWDSYSDERSTQSALRLKEAEAFQISAFNVHALTRALEDFTPDVVYLWMLVGIGGLGLVGTLRHLGVPWVWHLMDDVPPRLCMTFYEVRAALAHEFSRQFQGTFLACSQQLLDDIARRGFSLGDRVEVVPNWLSGPVPPLRSRFRGPGEPLRIVAAAATIERSYDKGIDLLIKAAALLHDAGNDAFSIEIFGQINDAYFPELVRSLGVDHLVRFRGSIDRSSLLASYAIYDVFAFPGRVGEPNAFAPLEAMPSGCVPVLSREGGNCEWLVHGVHCLKVPRTARGFAEAFGIIAGGEISLEAIGRRAAGAVRRDFHLEAVIPTIERALILASNRPRERAGSADEVNRLALLAEKITQIFMQEPYLVKTSA